MKIDSSKIRKDFANYLNLAHNGHVIIIMHHGVPQAKLSAINTDKSQLADISNFFGMWSNKKKSGTTLVNQMRSRRR